jgi:hypothetical protein
MEAANRELAALGNRFVPGWFNSTPGDCHRQSVGGIHA